ncbi:MAG: hypothetical protein KDC84_03800 [Crocinitomicaceae bacterium]|nr:hypothetical protein [Crocinitomicaceae bacterium]
MNRKTKLKKFFRSSQADLAYISEYESNQDYIEELVSNGYNEDLEVFLPIKLLKYADPLIKTGNYTKALKIILEIEESLKKMRSSKYYKPHFDYTMFLKAVCLGRLKKNNESNGILTDLLIKTPDNEKFSNWYRWNLKQKVDRVMIPFQFITIGIYLIMLVLDLIGYEGKNDLVQRLSFVLALVSVVVSYLIKKWIDNKTLKFGRKTVHNIT